MQAIASTSFLGQAMPVSAKAARQAADVKVTATFKKGGKRVAKKASKAAKPAGSAGWLGAGKDAALAKWCAPNRAWLEREDGQRQAPWKCRASAGMQGYDG